jgi:molybdopterin-synthase adenylyltransferase
MAATLAAQITAPMATQLARYARQAQVPGLDVDTLKRTRIAVAGAGAVGNEVVKNLVLMGVGAIDLYDFDHVEIHNLTRSVFLRESDIGLSKAQAVAQRAGEVDPQVRITPYEGDVWRTLPLQRLARCTALICAVDNIEARMRLSQLCLLAGVRFINAGIDQRLVSVETLPFECEKLCACYECHLPASAYARVAERYSCGWLRRALQVQRSVPTTAITASLAGALAVQAALNVGGASSTVTQRVLLDSRSGSSTLTQLARNPACAACAAWPDGSPRPRLVHAAQGQGWLAALREHAPQAEAVRLSDALIFGAACKACGSSQVQKTLARRRADEFDDRAMQCGACQAVAVQLDIRTEALVSDLENCFGATHLPLKFLLIDAGVAVVAGGQPVARQGITPGPLCLDLEPTA